jgi:ubiquinone/menaquinone biosynthesis C-methylase UbiE
MHEHKDTWADGANYEYYIGRWSRLVARKFIAWLDILSYARWLDVGCGTGILSQTILDVASPQKVLGVDSYEGYLNKITAKYECASILLQKAFLV